MLQNRVEQLQKKFSLYMWLLNPLTLAEATWVLSSAFNEATAAVVAALLSLPGSKCSSKLLEVR